MDLPDDIDQQPLRRSLEAFESRYGNDYIVFDGDVLDEAQVEHFRPDYYREMGCLSGQAQGRGTTYFVQWHDMQCVLRHYHRGGWMARWNRDRYWWRGVAQTRAWCEWYLLQQMYAQGLPVPQPLAAHVKHEGLFYRADLITRRVDSAHALSQVLSDERLYRQHARQSLWPVVGATIRRFHNAGIYHADLNAHNILLDAQAKCFLIDFDKGEQRQPELKWQQANLMRLQRSLSKLRRQNTRFRFDGDDWDVLLQGYAQASAS